MNGTGIHPSQAVTTAYAMANGSLGMLPLLGVGLVVFLLFWALASGVRRAVERMARARSEFPSAATAIGRLANILLMLLGLLVAVAVAFPSMTPARLFSALGIGGVAIGFAFKDIFQNLLAGILLLIRRPFRIGEEITTGGGFTGTVEAIEARAIFTRTYDRQRVIVPNSVIYTETMTVITAHDLLRSEYDVGIGYGDDVSAARRIALGAVQDVIEVRDRVLRAVVEALAGAGIDLPYPTTPILFHHQTEAVDGDRRRQRERWAAGDAPPEPRRSLSLRIERPAAGGIG